MLRAIAFTVLLIAELLCPRAVLATVWGQTSEPPVRVGALLRVDLEEISSQEAILLDRLRREMLPRHINLQYFSETELSHAVRNKSVDFIIADALTYSAMQTMTELKPLVGLVYPEAVDADHMTASVAFTAKTAGAPKVLSDLKGHHAVIMDAKSFGGAVALKAELADKGFDPSNFFSSVTEVGGTYAELVKDVLATPTSVGILPACTLERLAGELLIDLDQINVVNSVQLGGLACRKSTKVYPGWVLASLPEVDLHVIRLVASTALASSAPGALQWSFPPSDFQKAHNVLIDLHLAPYADESESLWKRLFLRYRWWIIGALLLVLTITLHSFVVARLVRIRTRDLQNLMNKQIKMTEEILQTRNRLTMMEKVQAVSQMSTVFAHELKQPLAAIRNFSLGLMRRSERGELDATTMNGILKKVVFLTDQASSIVTHVRSYARAEQSERTKEDLNEIVHNSLKTFQHTAEAGPSIDLKSAPVPVWVEINRWEIELVILNLLKNASEATKGMPTPQIGIRITEDEHHAVLRISDNGRGADEETLKNIFHPLFTTKTAGMGLGLSIALSVAESHGGRIGAHRNRSEGLTMELVLPLYRVNENG